METFLTIVHILAAVFMILVILVQGGNQGGVGAAFGGGNSQGVFGASGATSFLAKVTYFIAGIFMLTSIGLSWAQKQSGETGLIDRLKEQSETSAPQTDSNPAEEAPTTSADDLKPSDEAATEPSSGSNDTQPE